MDREQQDHLSAKLTLELRRGVVVLAVMSQLERERYGYDLKKRLRDLGLAIDEGTLYPLLRRLESQGLLASRWLEKDGRKRRYYQMSEVGRAVNKALAKEWASLASTMEGLIGKEEA